MLVELSVSQWSACSSCCMLSFGVIPIVLMLVAIVACKELSTIIIMSYNMFLALLDYCGNKVLFLGVHSPGEYLFYFS